MVGYHTIVGDDICLVHYTYTINAEGIFNAQATGIPNSLLIEPKTSQPVLTPSQRRWWWRRTARGAPAHAHAAVPPPEDDACLVCKDGGSLLVCDCNYRLNCKWRVLGVGARSSYRSAELGRHTVYAD